MKKLVSILLTLTLVVGLTFTAPGCAAFKNWFCTVTLAELDLAKAQLDKAQEIYDALVLLEAVPDYADKVAAAFAALEVAKAVFVKLQENVCQTQEQINAAVGTLNALNTEVEVKMAKFGIKKPVKVLKIK